MKLIMPIDDAVESILDALPGFLRHVYVKRCQEVAYQQHIEESSAAKCVVQIDFAENYTCVFQHEVSLRTGIRNNLRCLPHVCGRVRKTSRPVDGVGGTVKRAVRGMVRCRRAIVTDVPTFVAAYRASCGTINILTCEAPSECLLPKEDCTVTSGIKTCHHID